MAITISGSGITSANIADGTIVNADINSSAAIDGDKVSGSFGKVLQVVTASKTDTFSTSSITPVIITGLSVSITPTLATSTILVSVNIGKSTNATGTATTNFYIYRDSTAILIGAAAGTRLRTSFSIGGLANNGQATSGSMTGIDSPASTSALTYALYTSSQNGGTGYVNRTSGDADNANNENARSISTITVTEIGA